MGITSKPRQNQEWTSFANRGPTWVRPHMGTPVGRGIDRDVLPGQRSNDLIVQNGCQLGADRVGRCHRGPEEANTHRLRRGTGKQARSRHHQLEPRH